MTTLLWILASLDLLGGIIIAFSGSLAVGLSLGLVGFALLGGLATIIQMLAQIVSNTEKLNDKLSQLEEKEWPFKAQGTYMENTTSTDEDRSDVPETTRIETSSVKAELVQNPESGEQQIICPKCGETQRASRKKCWKCGTVFYQEE